MSCFPPPGGPPLGRFYSCAGTNASILQVEASDLSGVFSVFFPFSVWLLMGSCDIDIKKGKEALLSLLFYFILFFYMECFARYILLLWSLKHDIKEMVTLMFI